MLPLESAESFTLSAATADLSPEESTNYEFGTKQELRDGRMGLAAAIFRLDKDKARTPDPEDPSLTILAGQQITNGLEVELSGKITEFHGRAQIIIDETNQLKIVEKSAEPAAPEKK